MNAVSPPSNESASVCPRRVRRMVACDPIAAGTKPSAGPFAALHSALASTRASLRVFMLDAMTKVFPYVRGMQCA